MSRGEDERMPVDDAGEEPARSDCGFDPRPGGASGTAQALFEDVAAENVC